MAKFLPIALVFLLANIISNAQSQKLSLQDALVHALKNNYDIVLARQDSAEAAINFANRNGVFFPKVNSSIGIVHSTNNQHQTLADNSEKSRNGIQNANLTSSLNLNWILFDGLRMFLVQDQIKLDKKIGNLVIKKEVINLVANTITGYYDLVRQIQQLNSIDEQLHLANDRLTLAQYRNEIGVGIMPEVLQAQIDRNNSKASRFNQLSLIRQRRQSLNQLMNIALTTEYTVSDTIPTDKNLVVDNLISQAADGNAEILIGIANIENLRLAVKLAKANKYPTVSLTSAYNFTRSTTNQAINPFSVLYNLNKGWNYGINATIPIFNNFSIKQQIQQAKLNQQFEEVRLENQRLIINTSLSNAYTDYESQKQVMLTLDSNVILVRSNLLIEKERYRLGKTTFIELRQAEENVSNVQINLINARYNLKAAETELLRLSGRLIK